MGSGGDARRDSSNLTTALVVDYVRTHRGDPGVTRLLELAGETRPLAELEDTSQWGTQEQKVALLEAATVLFDDPDVPFRIGQAAAHANIGAPLRFLLRSFGSPAGLARGIARASAKFSSNYTCWTVSSGRTEALIGNRLHDGYEPQPLDCRYTAGLLTQIPVIFGLPPARVDHVECQVLGADACMYHLRWRPYRRVPWLRGHGGRRDEWVEMMTRRHDDVESAVTDLVSADSLDVVLRRITRRAAEAVNAPMFVLAVRDDNDRLKVYSDGMEREDAERVGREIISCPEGRDDARRLVVTVESARRSFGRLAAICEVGGGFFAEERELLESYARQAALALEVATSVDQARDREEAARALLALARALAAATSSDAVARRLAEAVPTVLGGERSAVLLWRPEERALVRVASAPPPADGADEPFVIRPGDTPALDRLLAGGAAEHHHVDRSDDAFLRTLLATSGQEEVFCVPIGGEGQLTGVVCVTRGADGPPFSDRRQILPRLAGLADQAAVALEKVRLLEQERAAVARLQADEERIRHLAYHDALTGLANGRQFSELLDAQIAAATATDSHLALLFCDLDRFKKVNDSLGHGAGDDLLRLAGQRIAGVLRGADALARLGGDEFAVLMQRIDSRDDVTALATRIVGALSEPFVIGGQQVFVAASIGSAVFPDDGADATSLFKNADTAMYAAKRDRCGVAPYTATMNAGARRELVLEAELHEAIATGSLLLHYQPQLDVAGRIVALEALVRWPHPTRGLLAPGGFLALAEETGLIVPLDHWVLEEVCRQARAWDEAGLPPVRITLNVSVRSFTAEFVERVAHALRRDGLAPGRLEIELTETVAVTQTETAAPLLARLDALGVSLAIDDFGVGYSSLGRLRDLTFHRLKIDRSFVSGLPDDPFSAGIVTAIVEMSHVLGIQVVAEGVETAQQQAALVARGCDLMQGYLFARPEPASAVAERLALPHAAALSEASLVAQRVGPGLGTRAGALRGEVGPWPTTGGRPTSSGPSRT